MKILFLGRALLPSTPSLGNLPPDAYRHIEESQRAPEGETKFPAGKLTPSAPYAGRRYFALAFELTKIAEVKFYGPGYPEYRESWLPTWNEIDVMDVISRLYPGDYPDAVVQLSPCNPEGLFGSWRNFEKAKCLRVLWAADFHNDIGHPGVDRLLRSRHWDLVIKSWDARNLTEWSGRVLDAGVPMEWLPFSFDPAVFRDYGLPKVYDVINMGTFAPQHYPLRQAVHAVLNPLRGYLKYLCGYDFISPENSLAGVMTDDYARIINQGKMYATCTSSFRYFGLKLLEILACNTLLLCDTPMDAEEMGLRAGENYVSLDELWHVDREHPENRWLDAPRFLELVNLYLTHPDEAARIARNGHALAHSRHTNEIRAKEFLGILGKYA